MIRIPISSSTAARLGVVSLACFLGAALRPTDVAGQASLFFGSQRPFVIGIQPVVGPGGAVGGVAVDAEGVVALVDRQDESLSQVHRAARPVVDSDEPFRPSRLRKISLRRLDELLRRCREEGRRPNAAVQNLAGLQRVEYVLVYPEHRDLVLAGPAEAWKSDGQGVPRGVSSGTPPVQLEDLVVALRSAQNELTCSIDPSREGMLELQQLLRSPHSTMSDSMILQLEQALGPQVVTIEGLSPKCHFARVMLAADVRMKNLAMGLEVSPLSDLSSYMEMLQEARSVPGEMTPRWWLAPDYDPLRTNGDGTAWQLCGQGVRVRTEDSYFTSRGEAVRSLRDNPLARTWAQEFTEHYSALSRKVPIFGQLRNCMDLAVVSALIMKERLLQQAQCELVCLPSEDLMQVAEYPAPKRIASRASFFRMSSHWIVSISGGVRVDGWEVLEQVEVDTALRKKLTDSSQPPGDRWWWD